MDVVGVQEFSRSLVLPAQPTTRHCLFLPCLDIFWKDLPYSRRLFFYESTSEFVAAADDGIGTPLLSSEDRRIGGVVEQLKSSLALCLVPYHPFCGRIAHCGRLVIDCNDAGVDFVVACTDVRMTELSKDGYQMKPFFDKLCQRIQHTGDCLYSSPLLSIQVTVFPDGGLAIGISHSHVVVDARALWNFMVSWGECSRGVALSHPPSHNRERLSLHHPSPERAKLDLNPAINKLEEDGTTVDQVEKEHGKEDSATGGTNDFGESSSTLSAADHGHIEGSDDGATSDLLPDPSLVQCLFELSSTSIKKLKSDAGGMYSSYEVTCAHFWKRVTAARKSPPHQRTFFGTPADCRNRITPPLPATYFGNVVMFGISVASAGKLCRETLAATASRIHDTVAGITEDALLGFMHWLETHDNSLRSAVASPPEGKGMNAANSPRFPVYQVDFGWGQPAAVRCAKVEVEGEMVLFGGRPGSSPGDVEICVALPASVLRRLLQDPEFLAQSPKGGPPSMHD